MQLFDVSCLFVLNNWASIVIIQALLGFERNLTHLDGHVVSLKRESVTQPGLSLNQLRCPSVPDIDCLSGYVQTVKDEGMPVFSGSDHGDLYIEYNVVLPKSLSSEKQKSKSMALSSSESAFSPFDRAG